MMKSLFIALAAFFGLSSLAAPANYVIVIELSPRMDLRREATARAAQDLIRTGIHERIKEGQKLEIWFYDEKLQSDILGVPWDPPRAWQLGAEAANAVRAKKSPFIPRPDRALAGLQAALLRSDEVTAMIFTDGASPFLGTPFDNEINDAFATYFERFSVQNKPFFVTLLGRDGEWVAYGVHTNIGGIVQLPKFPPRPVVAETPKAQPQEKKIEPTPAPKPEVKVAAARPPETSVEKTPTIEKPDPTPIKIETKSEPKSEPKPTAVKPIEPVIKQQPAPEPPKIVARVEPEKPKTLPLAEPEPAVIAQSPVTNSPPVQAVNVPPQAPRFPWPILLAVLGLIAAGGVAFYMRMKESNASRSPSLISQALDSNTDESMPRLPASPGTRLKIRLPPANPPVEQERPKREE